MKIFIFTHILLSLLVSLITSKSHMRHANHISLESPFLESDYLRKFTMSPISPPTIDVVGRARTTLKTDLIKINIQIITLESSAYDAMRKNTEISSNLDDLLLNKLNIEKDNITTRDYSLSPQYNYINNTKHFEGYQAKNSLILTLSNLTVAGRALDEMSKLSSNLQIDSINFEVSTRKQDQVKDYLIQEAVADATRTAKIGLKGVNSEVKAIKSMTINNYNVPTPTPRYRYAMASMSAPDETASPSLYGGTQEVSLSVSISFYIGPKN